ncbi:MAG: ATP-binding protein [Hydrococcus sp. Prado102]|jgi:signal transduction histidine kinase/CheY-like chemotaxis protein|nr:ATP-binding protein [Hydrococcus sp. Prado102]
MSTPSLTLDRFVRRIPVDEPTTNLVTALTKFQSNPSEIIAIVSKEGLPLGIIRSQILLARILKHLPDKSGAAGLKSASLARIKLKSLMEPVTILPGRMSVNEFWRSWQEHYLDASSNLLHLLVDNEGKLLGLLDRWSLSQSLLAERDETLAKLPLPFEGLFFQLLEQFPLPMMVYTSQGQIFYQNSNWCQQIGEFFPLDEGSFCPLMLEPIPAAQSVPSSLATRAESIPKEQFHSTKDSHYLSDQLLEFIPELVASAVANSLKLSSVPLQPKNFGDRAWQFIKLPFNALSNSLEAELFKLQNANPSFWLVVATDVTEHQQLCQELSAKNADLVQLNRLKDEFLACISHELKSPLTAVLGLSSLLKEQKLGELNQRQVRYAQLIYQSGRQLMSLVNDLLDLTRLETGQLKLNPTSISIKTLCEQTYAAIAQKYEDKTDRIVSFSLDIEAGLKTIVADELRLRQILVHLLDNAVKFTPEGQEIGLKVNLWEKWLAFTVWDKGIGIPEEHQHLIFQKFQQLESPLTRQFEGTGLGLFLAQRLAKAHGGDISFISKVGRGSQFTLLLPPNPTDVAQPQQRYPLVLVVESQPKAIEDLTEKLVDLEYRVAIARTGTEALEKARQLQPHAILLDPNLPLLSGWDVLTLLKSNRQTKQIRVILTANQSQKPNKKQGGIDGFLDLPVNRDALQVILEEKETQLSLKNLTILHLYLESESSTDNGLGFKIDLALVNQLSQMNHRIIEADDLEQAEMLASVWNIDVIVLEGSISETSLDYLRSLGECEQLSKLPLITLDAKTTEAANRVGNLYVFPCLLSANNQNGDRLLQVIQIAAENKIGD